MNSLIPFIESNQLLLEQIRRQLELLNPHQDDIYSKPIPIVGGASIGAHLRHILDFYSAYYSGLKKNHIDYDNRQRNNAIELQRESGLQQLSVVIQQLETLKVIDNKPVTIKATTEIENSQSVAESNLTRELQSLHSHTTHHMAIIAIALKLSDIGVDDDFGKAPSTIQYERSLKAASQPAAID